MGERGAPKRQYFNPRSLTGATSKRRKLSRKGSISIHAPSRERHIAVIFFRLNSHDFNPRSLTGATLQWLRLYASCCYFNPRSLTGATQYIHMEVTIHQFQSTLPHGSDELGLKPKTQQPISIHAPSRERPRAAGGCIQSINFNPRSLTGATIRR